MDDIECESLEDLIMGMLMLHEEIEIAKRVSKE
jgi:hypothetical protein